MTQTVSLCHFQVPLVIGLKNTPHCHRIKSHRREWMYKMSTHAHQSTELCQVERITMSHAPHLPFIVVSPIVWCNYFVGAPQRAPDHSLALGHAAKRKIIKHRKKIEANLCSLSLRSFIRRESDRRIVCLYHFVKSKLNLSRWEQAPGTLRTVQKKEGGELNMFVCVRGV